MHYMQLNCMQCLVDNCIVHNLILFVNNFIFYPYLYILIFCAYLDTLILCPYLYTIIFCAWLDTFILCACIYTLFLCILYHELLIYRKVTTFTGDYLDRTYTSKLITITRLSLINYSMLGSYLKTSQRNS